MLKVGESKKFNCPICHTDDPLLSTIAKDEKEVFKEGDIIGMDNGTVLLANNTEFQKGNLAGKKAKILSHYSDICGNCGNVYIYLISLKEIVIPAPQHRSGSVMPPTIHLPGNFQGNVRGN